METNCNSNANKIFVPSLTNKILAEKVINKGQFKKGSSGFKGKHHTEISKQQQSESHKGYIPSQETKQKLRVINSGINNPMFGVHKFGKEAPNYGKHQSEESRKRISEGHRGLHLSDKTKLKISNKLKGIAKSKEHRKNLSLSHKGKPTWNKDRACPQLSGNNNPNWLNGKSFEPYTSEFNKAFKLAIKQRDGFMCIKCGMREEDARILFKKNLHVHHVDYIKGNTLKENCCALCNRCNSEVNFNRVHWTRFFQSLLNERYGYQYDENLNIILNLEVGTK